MNFSLVATHQRRRRVRAPCASRTSCKYPLISLSTELVDPSFGFVYRRAVVVASFSSSRISSLLVRRWIFFLAKVGEVSRPTHFGRSSSLELRCSVTEASIWSQRLRSNLSHASNTMLNLPQRIWNLFKLFSSSLKSLTNEFIRGIFWTGSVALRLRKTNSSFSLIVHHLELPVWESDTSGSIWVKNPPNTAKVSISVSGSDEDGPSVDAPSKSYELCVFRNISRTFTLCGNFSLKEDRTFPGASAYISSMSLFAARILFDFSVPRSNDPSLSSLVTESVFLSGSATSCVGRSTRSSVNNSSTPIHFK